MSNSNKEYVKGQLDAVNDTGEQLDNQMSQIVREQIMHLGARDALLSAAKVLDSLHTHAQSAFDAGELKGIGGLEGLATLKSYIARAQESARNLSHQAEAARIEKAGAEKAIKTAVSIVQKRAVGTKSRLTQLHEQEKEPQTSRPPRGGRTAAASRSRSSSAKKASKKTKKLSR